MRNDLQLYIPRPEDGWFYCQMMSDPETMAYHIHRAAGFRQTGMADGFIQLELTREAYLQAGPMG